MTLPETVYDPPFAITRASHVALTVRDLEASRRFYTEVIGLVVTTETPDTLYLRGLEEAAHHSLVLHRAGGERSALRIGMRVQTDAHLDKAFAWLSSRKREPAWAQCAHQGRTLHFTDPVGVPIELCSRMDAVPRMITQFHLHKGGCAQRIDHYQILTPKVPEACAFYMALGFRLSEYIAPENADPFGVFLQRKGNPHDIVFFNGSGPRLHHFAFTAPETHHLLRACDIAGTLGFGRDVERGPGRHGPGHAMFVYFRDPDGHRVELFNTHYQIMDEENEPVRWDPGDTNISYPWGLPAQRAWFEEATPFAGITPIDPAKKPDPMTLQKYLAR